MSSTRRRTSERADGRSTELPELPPETNLNDAAALWRAAPYEVNERIECDILNKWDADLDMIEATHKLFTNPAALTRDVVEKWEAFNESK